MYVGHIDDIQSSWTDTFTSSCMRESAAGGVRERVGLLGRLKLASLPREPSGGVFRRRLDIPVPQWQCLLRSAPCCLRARLRVLSKEAFRFARPVGTWAISTLEFNRIRGKLRAGLNFFC